MFWDTLWHLVVVFGQASLLALGGGTAVLGDLQRESVVIYRWLSGKQFVDVFAITQATPGPSMLIVSLIGYWSMAQHYPDNAVMAFSAGMLGAIVATTAMFLPASILAYYIGGWWQHFHQSNWRVPLEKGLSAVTVGLLFASAVIISDDAVAVHMQPHVKHSKQLEMQAKEIQAQTAASLNHGAPTAATTPSVPASEPDDDENNRWRAWVVIAVTAYLLAFTKVNPLLLMAVAGVLGFMRMI